MVKDNSSKQVTLSKRRAGLFKKANELATLCAYQIALVVFSPGGKPCSFGHPDIESVAERFLNEGKKQKARTKNLNSQLDQILKQIPEEKKRREFLEEMMRKEKESSNFKPIEEMNINELLEMKEKLEVLRISIKTHATEAEASSSLLLLSKKRTQDVLKEPINENDK